MDTWMRFWTPVLVTSLVGFALLAAVVAIGGLRDLLRMFSDLERERRADDDSPSS